MAKVFLVPAEEAQLLDKHSLRAADSLQLAASLISCD
jgi:hypothetical protein